MKRVLKTHVLCLYNSILPSSLLMFKCYKCYFSPGSVISRHVQFCGQRNWLCKLLPDSKYISPDCGINEGTIIFCLSISRLSDLFLSRLADRSPGGVPQEVIRAASKCSASDQSSSGWVWDQQTKRRTLMMQSFFVCYRFPSLTASFGSAAVHITMRTCPNAFACVYDCLETICVPVVGIYLCNYIFNALCVGSQH